MNRDELDKDLNEMLSNSKRLFGDVEEMDKDELVQLLDDSGRPSQAVRQAAYLAFDGLVRNFRLRGQYAPERYKDIVNQLRPPEILSHDPSALAEQAKRWVTSLLEMPTFNEVDLQLAFHRRSELTDSDQRILEETKAEVSRRMKKKNE